MNQPKNYMTGTERMTMKHVFKLNHHLIDRFEDLDLDDETRRFLIFDVMFKIYEKAEKKRGY